MKFRCTVCNWIYNEDKGHPDSGIDAGTKFDDIPGDWTCPICGASKKAFVNYGEEQKGKVTTIVADVIVDQLKALGVKYIFGIPGDSNLPIFESIRKKKTIKFILTRHEETAAFMACAYAKATGNLGVCISIAGPGSTNLITGLLDAATDKAPVLAITGQVAQPYLGSEAFQEIDQVELFHPFCVSSEVLADSSQATRLVMNAVKTAYANHGVAHLSTPTDVLAEPLSTTILDPSEHIVSGKSSPTEKDIDKIVKLINSSKKPVLFGGWGIRDCGKEFLKLAEKLNAPIATTSRAKGVVKETHPLVMGVLGSIGTPYASKAVSSGDLLIIVGSGFRQKNLVRKDMVIIQCDHDNAKVGKTFAVKAGVTSDAKEFICKLLEKVDKKKKDEEFFKNINEIRKEHENLIIEYSKNDSVPLFPGRVIQEIKKVVNKDAIICSDVGDHTYWLYKDFICDGQRTYLSANMASMGFGLPGALACQLAYPKKQVVCVTGDGGFSMLMADFTTAVMNNLPIKVVVFNDSKLKNIKKEQERYGFKEFGVSFVNPNFADFAKSCGGEGYRIEKVSDFSMLKKAFTSSKPCIIDVVVDPEKYIPGVKAVPK
ncbi:thiamine pyrophosphate-binding protein [Nanoarchaeota archaeon]